VRVQRRVGQRRAGGVDGGTADQLFFKLEIMAEALGHALQHFDRSGGDFRADAVTWQDKNMGFHGVPWKMD